jgi:iron complex transport system ATP-binding protein
MTLLSVRDLSVMRGDCPVVDRVSFDVQGSEIIGLIGPNGAGKTTLMRGALGLLPAQGESSLARMSPRDRGRAAAWMPQNREIAWPVSVDTLVTLGRIPHLPAGPRDREAVEGALARLELGPFRNRIATQLSGGEQARVLLARVLAQETPLILADEPIAGLDPAHQIATMEVFAALASEGRAVIVALHDLGLAARHCTRLLCWTGAGSWPMARPRMS